MYKQSSLLINVQQNVKLLWWQCLRSLDMPEKRKQADAVRKRLGKWRAGLEKDPFSQQVSVQLLWLLFFRFAISSPKCLLKHSSWSSYSVRWNGGPDLAPCLFDQIHGLSCNVVLGTSKFFKAWFTPLYSLQFSNHPMPIPCLQSKIDTAKELSAYGMLCACYLYVTLTIFASYNPKSNENLLPRTFNTYTSTSWIRK